MPNTCRSLRRLPTTAKSRSSSAGRGCIPSCSKCRCWRSSTKCISGMPVLALTCPRDGAACRRKWRCCARHRGTPSAASPTTARAGAMAVHGMPKWSRPCAMAWAASWPAPATCGLPVSWASRRWAPWRTNICRRTRRWGHACAIRRWRRWRRGRRNTGAISASRCRTSTASTLSCAISTCTSASSSMAPGTIRAIRLHGAKKCWRTIAPTGSIRAARCWFSATGWIFPV